MNELFSQGGKGSTGILTNKQAVARHFGVKQSEVIYFSVGAILSGYKVIYDKETQRAYSLPIDIPVGATATSLTSSGLLVHSEGTVDLGAYALSRRELNTPPGSLALGTTLTTKNDVVVEDGVQYAWAGALPKVVPASSTIDSTGGVSPTTWVAQGSTAIDEELASPIGYSLIGEVDSFASLRVLVPTAAGQRVKLRSWYNNTLSGGGDFIAVAGDLTDDGGITARVNSSFSWQRLHENRITPEMFGCIGDGITDDAANLNKFFAAASANKIIGEIRSKIYDCRSVITIPAYASIECYGLPTIRRNLAVNYTSDFLSVLTGATVRGLYIEGNRLDTQAPAEVVLVRIGNGVILDHCTIAGNSGYGVVGNAVNGVEITKCKLQNFAKGAIAFFGDNTSASSNVLVKDIFAVQLGAGAVYIGNYTYSKVDNVRASGTHIGAPGNRTYVNTSTTGAVTHSSGLDFTGVKPGMWLVLPGGSEHMVTAVSSATNMTVSPVPPSNGTFRALVGTGDMIGVQECVNVDIVNCVLENGVTYGTGGGTMTGSSNACIYCTWENNYIRNFGKNGINLGQSGGDVVSCTITGNTLVSCGNGGKGTGPSQLLPWFDTCGIALSQVNAGKLINIDVSNNNVITWGGDLGDGECWFGMSGCSEGSVTCHGNTQSGYADGYVRGDIIKVLLTGYGTGAAATSFVSNGESIQIVIQTGTSPSASPYFSVRKVIRTRTQPMITAQIITTSGNMSHCWGMQFSTASLWQVGRNTMPSGIDTYYVKS